MRRFREIKDFGLERLSTRATTLQEVGILPTLVYFHPKGCFGFISTLRSRLALFSTLRGYLAWVKTTLIVVLRPICGRLCVLICSCVICPKKCLETVWIKKNYSEC